MAIKRNRTSKNKPSIKMSVPKMGVAVQVDNQKILDDIEEMERKKMDKKRGNPFRCKVK